MVTALLLIGSVLCVSQSKTTTPEPGSATLYYSSPAIMLKKPEPFVVELVNHGANAVRVSENLGFERRKIGNVPAYGEEKRIGAFVEGEWVIFIECWCSTADWKYGYVGRHEVNQITLEPGKATLIKFSIPPAFLADGTCKIRVRVERDKMMVFRSQYVTVECRE